MGCVTDVCKKDPFSFNTELVHPNTGLKNESNMNYSFIKEPQYNQLSKDFFEILNEIRLNPEKYLNESKEHNLFEIFIKLKPCQEINFVENNIDEIKKYIYQAHFMNKSINEQEKDLKKLINENINDLCLFRTVCSNNDMKENVWSLLEDNEDDIEKIFDMKYNNLIIVCIPLDYNTQLLLNLIFYVE